MTSLKKKSNNIKPCILQRISYQAKNANKRAQNYNLSSSPQLGSKKRFKSKIVKKQTVYMDAKAIMDLNIQQRCHSLAINVFKKSLLN